MREIGIVTEIKVRWLERACSFMVGMIVTLALGIWVILPWTKRVEKQIQEQKDQHVRLVEVGGFVWKINGDNSTEVARFEFSDPYNSDNWTVRWEPVEDLSGWKK